MSISELLDLQRVLNEEYEEELTGGDDCDGFDELDDEIIVVW